MKAQTQVYWRGDTIRCHRARGMTVSALIPVVQRLDRKPFGRQSLADLSGHARSHIVVCDHALSSGLDDVDCNFADQFPTDPANPWRASLQAKALRGRPDLVSHFNVSSVSGQCVRNALNLTQERSDGTRTDPQDLCESPQHG